MKKTELSVACMHVINGERPVLYVWKEGGEAAFACGRDDHRSDTIADWAVVHTIHLVESDPLLEIGRELADGEATMRLRAGAPWLRLRV